MYNSLIFFARHLFFLLLLPRCSSLPTVRPAALSCHPLRVGPTLITVDLDVHVSQPARPYDRQPKSSTHLRLATCNAISIPGAASRAISRNPQRSPDHQLLDASKLCLTRKRRTSPARCVLHSWTKHLPRYPVICLSVSWLARLPTTLHLPRPRSTGRPRSSAVASPPGALAPTHRSSVATPPN